MSKDRIRISPLSSKYAKTMQELRAYFAHYFMRDPIPHARQRKWYCAKLCRKDQRCSVLPNAFIKTK